MRSVRFVSLVVVVCVLAACGPAVTPTPLPPAITPTPNPDIEASSIDQVAGVWAIRLAGGGENDPAHFTLAEDGSYAIDAVGGYHKGMHIEDGKYWFDGGVMKLETDMCQRSDGEWFHCIASYQVFVAAEGGKPVRLRMVAIDDPRTTDRRSSLNGKTFAPAEP